MRNVNRSPKGISLGNIFIENILRLFMEKEIRN